MFRRDFEQRLDRFACAIICELFQPIAQRKEKEQRRAFGPSLNEQGADRDGHHQELDVDLAPLERVPHILSGEPAAADISQSKKGCDQLASAFPRGQGENRQACSIHKSQPTVT